MPTLSTQEKIKILKWYFGGNSMGDITNLFINEFEGKPIPAKSTISKIVKKFEKYGCVQYCRHCLNVDEPRIKTINKEREQRESNVCAAVDANENITSKQIGKQLNLNDRTVRNILKRKGYHCYKLKNYQVLWKK